MPAPVVGVAPLPAATSEGVPLHRRLVWAVCVAAVAASVAVVLGSVGGVAAGEPWSWVNIHWHLGGLVCDVLVWTPLLAAFLLVSEWTRRLSRARALACWLAIAGVYAVLLAPAVMGLQQHLYNTVLNRVVGLGALPLELGSLAVWSEVADAYRWQFQHPSRILWTLLTPGIPLLVLAGTRAILRWPGWAQILAVAAGNVLAGVGCGALLGHLGYPGQPWGDFALALSTLGLVFWASVPLGLGVGESAAAWLGRVVRRVELTSAGG